MLYIRTVGFSLAVLLFRGNNENIAEELKTRTYHPLKSLIVVKSEWPAGKFIGEGKQKMLIIRFG